MVGGSLRELIGAIVRGESESVAGMLGRAPSLAREACPDGATRDNAREFFFPEIGHYLYAGDTALHMAAAAFAPEVVHLLVGRGADVNVQNRRGARPLHYAADTSHDDPTKQAATVARLLAEGAEVDASDRDGVTPLHRAVRTRGASAVEALLRGGASPRLPNGRGSTPLHLAVRDTGRGQVGDPVVRARQSQIIELLLAHGADAADCDGQGKRVADTARSSWIRELLSRSA